MGVHEVVIGHARVDHTIVYVCGVVDVGDIDRVVDRGV
jgi:hypothetical protein